MLEPQAKARVTLKPKVRFTSAREWRSRIVYEQGWEIVAEIGPGESEVMEFVTP